MLGFIGFPRPILARLLRHHSQPVVAEIQLPLDYFAPAVQLGLTATPKRRDNVDTYANFGEPVFIYSLKDSINDGFLTPFRVKQISTTLDEYDYAPDDTVIEGEIEAGKRYVEAVPRIAS